MAEETLRRDYIGVLLGKSEVGPVKEPQLISRWGQFIVRYGGVLKSKYLGHAVNGYLENGGQKCYVVNVGEASLEDYTDVLGLLEGIEGIAYIAAPGETDIEIQEELIKHCEEQGDRIAILDLPQKLEEEEEEELDIPLPSTSDYRLCFYPWVLIRDYKVGYVHVPPSGHMMGIIAKNAIRQRSLNPSLEGCIIEGIRKLEYKVEGEQLEYLTSNGVTCLSYNEDSKVGIFSEPK